MCAGVCACLKEKGGLWAHLHHRLGCLEKNQPSMIHYMYPAELSELAAILATATTLHRRGNLSGTLMSDQNLANEKGGAGRQRDDALS